MDFSELASEMANDMLKASEEKDQVFAVIKSINIIINTLNMAYQKGFAEGFTQAMSEKEGKE